ncbi:hypothetical protein EYF80_044194 [Liparis tanakae]|uniref:Uncharacterized protein n=1 Tax=Liparis tanakae TaxID=230148 RepID=A0A4Z2FWG5_9TELE|nr:hypothetical protein EYF80_044194 [Liparis tanakae]
MKVCRSWWKKKPAEESFNSDKAGVALRVKQPGGAPLQCAGGQTVHIYGVTAAVSLSAKPPRRQRTGLKLSTEDYDFANKAPKSILTHNKKVSHMHCPSPPSQRQILN